MARAPDVLIAGAGPTGLALALQAHTHGARVRIVERRPDPFRRSRAAMVHIRTLEVLRPLGVVDALLERAAADPGFTLHGGHRTAHLGLGRIAIADTPYPHLTLLRQADVESVLGEALAERGIPIERGTEVVDLADPADPRVTLRAAGGSVTTQCGFLAGCDGVDSIVRSLAGIGWSGGSYSREIVLADLDIAGLDPDSSHVAVGPAGMVFAFRLGEGASWRLLATRPAGSTAGGGHASTGATGAVSVPVRELAALLTAAEMPGQITDVAWSAAIRLRYGRADAYRRGQVFLAGDAAHVHSPAGGQGMNTGIQDAINLGWKLAYSPRSRRSDDLLDSYEVERRGIARIGQVLTDALFWAESATDPAAAAVRRMVAWCGPTLAPAALSMRPLVAELMRIVSQLWISYRGGPMVVLPAVRQLNQVRAGDRLPDAAIETTCGPARLHDLLAEPGFHLLLDRDAEEPSSVGASVHLHRLTTPGTGVITVRPDGYAGLVAAGRADVEHWLAAVGA